MSVYENAILHIQAFIWYAIAVLCLIAVPGYCVIMGHKVFKTSRYFTVKLLIVLVATLTGIISFVLGLILLEYAFLIVN